MGVDTEMIKKREGTFWDFLNDKMGNRWDVQRHEDKYSVGIPDLSYGINGVNGWIELKACPKWPTKGIPYYTPAQANWLTARGKKGGRCFILVKIIHSDGYSICLFSWESAYLLLSTLSEKIMIDNAIFVSDNGLSVNMFIERLTLWKRPN